LRTFCAFASLFCALASLFGLCVALFGLCVFYTQLMEFIGVGERLLHIAMQPKRPARTWSVAYFLRREEELFTQVGTLHK
jgi:hypothetical protein